MYRTIVFALCCSLACSSDISDEELLSVSGDMFKQAGHAGSAFVINLQGQTTSQETEDKACGPLITSLDQSVLQHPSITLLYKLFDNYIANENDPEDVTSGELQEVDDFLNEVMSSDVMKTVHEFLASKGEVPADSSEFQAFLKQIWFDLYERNHALSSSGFEHVFVGEKKGSEVGGLHNWVRYYDLESKGASDYQGYIKAAVVDGLNIVTYRMNWDEMDAKKPINTALFGIYPEYELATLTLCWVTRPNRVCTINLGDHGTWQIQTYQQSYNGKTYVGSAYFL